MAENPRTSPTCNPRGYRFESWPRQNQFNKKELKKHQRDSWLKKVHLSTRKKRTFELVQKAFFLFLIVALLFAPLNLGQTTLGTFTSNASGPSWDIPAIAIFSWSVYFLWRRFVICKFYLSLVCVFIQEGSKPSPLVQWVRTLEHASNL